MSFAQLDDLNRKLNSLSHALSMLGVDEAVMMPEGGGEKRAEAIASLSGMYHDMAAAPHIAEWIAKAESEDLDATQRIAVKEFKRSYINRTCLSSAFVQKQTEQRLRCEQLWRQLRPTRRLESLSARFLRRHRHHARRSRHARRSPETLAL